MARFVARYSPARGRGYGGWGAWDTAGDSYVWVRRGAPQEVAQGLATWLDAVITDGTDTATVSRMFAPYSHRSGTWRTPPLPALTG